MVSLRIKCASVGYMGCNVLTVVNETVMNLIFEFIQPEEGLK